MLCQVVSFYGGTHVGQVERLPTKPLRALFTLLCEHNGSQAAVGLVQWLDDCVNIAHPLSILGDDDILIAGLRCVSFFMP